MGVMCTRGMLQALRGTHVSLSPVTRVPGQPSVVRGIINPSTLFRDEEKFKNKIHDSGVEDKAKNTWIGTAQEKLQRSLGRLCFKDGSKKSSRDGTRLSWLRPATAQLSVNEICSCFSCLGRKFTNLSLRTWDITGFVKRACNDICS